MWSYVQNQRQMGPFAEPETLRLIQAGVITKATLVWAHGMANWLPAERTELGRHFVRPQPPVASGNTQFFIAKAGNRTGPFTTEQVRQMLTSGAVSGQDLAWKTGSSGWQPLAALTGSAQPVPVAPPILQSHAGQAPASLGAALNPARPVGGWLLFFCVVITILGPLFSLFSMVSAWVHAYAAFDSLPALRTALLVEDLGLLLVAVYGPYVGIELWARNPYGKKLAKQYLRARLAVGVGVEIVALLVMGSHATSAVLAAAFASCLREGVFFAVWWTYFKKSTRVNSAYPGQ
jgi:hypothetical protein